MILMDVQTERRENGLAAVEKIKASHPEIKIVVVTSLVDCEVLGAPGRPGRTAYGTRIPTRSF